MQLSSSKTNPKPKIGVPKFIKEAYLSTARILCIKAARRTGKTYNFALWLIMHLINEPGKSGLWIDTKHTNIDKYVERYFKYLLTKMNLWKRCNWNQQKKILTLHNGSYIDFGSAERPELLEGFGYDYAVLNEAGLILKKKSLWENTIYPMVKHAMVRIIGTPKGNNTFESLYRRYPHYSFTAYDSPYWTKKEIEDAKLTMTKEAFDQEMMAKFLKGSGAVFRNIEENISGKLLTKAKDNARYVLSADLAKHSDFTVIFVGDTITKQVVYHDRFNQIDWGLQKSRIVEAYKRFSCTSGVIDATGVGDSIFDDLQNLGLNLEGFKFTGASKPELISNLSIAMDNRAIKYPLIEPLIDELEIFSYEQRGNGSFSYSAPEGFHDDEVMALALLNRAMSIRQIEYAGVR